MSGIWRETRHRMFREKRIYLEELFLLFYGGVPGGALFWAALKFPGRGLEYLFLAAAALLFSFGAVRIELAALGEKAPGLPARKRWKNTLLFAFFCFLYILLTDWLSRNFTVQKLESPALFWAGIFPVLAVLLTGSGFFNLLLARIALEAPERGFFPLASGAARVLRRRWGAVFAIQLAGAAGAVALCVFLLLAGIAGFLGAESWQLAFSAIFAVLAAAAFFLLETFMLLGTLLLAADGNCDQPRG